MKIIKDETYLRAGGLCPPVHLLLATSWIPSHAFRFLEARIWVVAAANSREARGSPAPDKGQGVMLGGILY